MRHSLWIYSAKNQWFTNGKHTITVEVSHRHPFNLIRDIYFGDTGFYLHREDLEIGSHRDLARRLTPPWKPHAPEELMRILNERCPHGYVEGDHHWYSCMNISPFKE